ncbi:MAG TPA: hypothetical protein VJ001_16570 [Rhodocyclaceae bacterium]|nr:hypothetical protein [Rhodocyclaceae bacterium]
MTERQNEVRRILTKLTGNEPDNTKVAMMAHITQEVEVAPGNPLFPLMVALDHYLDSYESIPDAIKETATFILREHENTFSVGDELIDERKPARKSAPKESRGRLMHAANSKIRSTHRAAQR